jgi:hypothetical protein
MRRFPSEHALELLRLLPKLHSCHYPHLVKTNSRSEKRMFISNIPTGFNNTTQGCGTPLPWVVDARPLRFTPTGLRLSLRVRNPVGVG